MSSLQSYFFRMIIRLTTPLITPNTSIPELRAKIGAVSGKPFLSPGVTITSVRLDNVSAEWVYPPNMSPQSIILYLHGGGWTLGWTNSGRRMLVYLCKVSNCRALAVDYRLAPEHPFPAALSDCFSAYCWLINNGIAPQKIIIAGDSTGANLVLSTLLALRDAGDPLPAGAVCISPLTDLDCTGESFYSTKDPSLTSTTVKTMIHHYIGGKNPRLPLVSPLYASLAGFPPLLIHVGQDEILLSDAVRLADNARACGVDVRLVVWPRMWHVWHTSIPLLPEAKHAVNEISAFVHERVGS